MKRDAMPDGGILTFETAKVTLDESYIGSHADVAHGEYVMFTATDTGVGLDKETLDRAFEPFFTTKEQGKGTGLGLSTCYGIVKQSGGEISLRSEPGRGSLHDPSAVRGGVGVCRGVSRAAEGSSERPRPAPARGGCEDEPRVRAVGIAALRSRGYTRSWKLADGVEAQRLLESRGNEIDLIVSDIVMLQDAGGIELVKWTRARYPRIRLLLTSGYADRGIEDISTDRSAIRVPAKAVQRE